jgi:hypothetical protein
MTHLRYRTIYYCIIGLYDDRTHRRVYEVALFVLEYGLPLLAIFTAHVPLWIGICNDRSARIQGKLNVI